MATEDTILQYVTNVCQQTRRPRHSGLRRRRHLILKRLRAKGAKSAGVVGGLSGDARLTTGKPLGSRTAKCTGITLMPVLNGQPVREFADRIYRRGEK